MSVMWDGGPDSLQTMYPDAYFVTPSFARGLFDPRDPPWIPTVMTGICLAAAAVPITGAAFATQYMAYAHIYEDAFMGVPPETSEPDPPVIEIPPEYPTTPPPVTYVPLPVDNTIPDLAVSPPYSPTNNTIPGFLIDIRHYVTRFNRHMAPLDSENIDFQTSIPLVDSEYGGAIPPCDGVSLVLTHVPAKYGAIYCGGYPVRYPHIGWAMFAGLGFDRLQQIETINDVLIPEVLSNASGLFVKCKMGVEGFIVPFSVNMISD